jgi:hypothetical protein
MPIYRKTRLLFTLELEREVTEVPSYLRVLFSLPHRENVITKVWATPRGYLTDPQFMDLVNWIDQHCTDAIVAGYGVQSVLPGLDAPYLSSE